MCNCDAGRPETDTDSGFITNMSALPIMGFRYEKVNSDNQSASIYVGNLKCSGIKKVQHQSDIYRSCRNLKLSGVYRSGNYVLNDGSMVFCDMEKRMGDHKLQTHIKNILFKDVM